MKTRKSRQRGARRKAALKAKLRKSRMRQAKTIKKKRNGRLGLS